MKIATRLVLPILVRPDLRLRPAQRRQAAPLSIDTLMATPFPTDLVAAPTGGAIAWVSSNSGVHNILVAEPTPGTGPLAGRTDHKWRAVTTYTGDDGLWITDLSFTSDAKTIVYVRGDGANRQGENPNPAQLQDGTEQAVFAVSVDGGAPKQLGVGNGPVPSPRGQRVAWVSRGQIWSADLGATERRRGWSTRAAARRDSRGRRTARCSRSRAAAARTATSACSRSPRRSCATSIRRSIATATRRGRRTARRIAWIRQGAAPRARMFSPRRNVDEPWSLRVADVKTGRRSRCGRPTPDTAAPFRAWWPTASCIGAPAIDWSSRGRRTAGSISIPCPQPAARRRCSRRATSKSST